MATMLEHLIVGLRLHFRNRMALLYGYLFPVVFLVAFWVLYRHERVPLIRHLGELLTVTVLGGACFGLPTTLVSERERGVWRRYRLAPVPTASLIGSTLVIRYLILVTAGLLQIALAMALGMPFPRHPFDLWVAFTLVAFAFIGLGLVIAIAADTVPAVQALGQCIFLPMLIVGGVAVPLSSLPGWAQHVSAFLPGRYAVEALQACVSGDGLAPMRFHAIALIAIGAAGCIVGIKLFRWDAQQRFAAIDGKAWIAVALAAWAGVGLLAESQGRVVDGRRASSSVTPPAAQSSTSGAAPPSSSAAPPAPVVQGDARAVESPGSAQPVEPATPAKPPASGTASRAAGGVEPPPRPAADPRPGAEAPLPPVSSATPAVPPAPAPVVSGASRRWQDVTLEEIDREIVFTRLPPDEGVVTPIAPVDEEPDPASAEQLEFMRSALADWKPGKVTDPVQRARNYLFVAAVPDVFQSQIERFVPHLIFDRLQADIPADQLPKVLYWIALHPDEGDDSAVDELRSLRLGNGPQDIAEARQRVAIYAVKLLGRITGKIAQQ